MSKNDEHIQYDFLDLYERLGLPANTKNDNQAICVCPFHSDTKPSFTFNIETGLWKCFADTDCGHGNFKQFICQKFGVMMPTADHIFDCLLDPIEYDVQQAHNTLINDKKILEYVCNERKWTVDIIKALHIGYDMKEARIQIPIYIGNVLVNIRKYKLHCKPTEAKLRNYYRKDKDKEKATFYGKMQLYPFPNMFNGEEIYLMEGEADCILANALGLNAVTVTGGAGSFEKSWTRLFKDKDVKICYDADDTGREGAEKIASILKSVPRSVQIIDITTIKDLKEGTKDFSDLFIKNDITLDIFLESAVRNPVKLVVDAVTGETVNTAKVENKKEEPAEKISLIDSSLAKFHGKRVEIPVVISGKDIMPFMIPKVICARCLRATSAGNNKKVCVNCTLSISPKLEVEISSADQTALKLIRASETQYKGIIKDICGIPSQGCGEYEIKEVTHQNIEEVRVIPELNTNANSEYVSRLIYFMDTDNRGIKTNSSYTIEGTVMPMPNSQYATLLFDKAKPRENSLELFKLTDEMCEELKIFKVDAKHSVKEKIYEIVNDYSHNVTKIFKRDDLHIAILLTYYSVLQFQFMGSFVEKGYVECLILGDAGQGKSETIKGMAKHFQAGEIIDGATTSKAGLIGGISEIGGRHLLQWGIFPLNDRKILILEEAAAIDEETRTDMAELRSSGKASINKIQRDETFARVRVIWVSNPVTRKKNLDDYNYGILAVYEIMPHPKDIRRLDFVLGVGKDEVSDEEIVEETHKEVPHKYGSDKAHNLLMWAWSRKPEHIIFEDDAISVIIKYGQQIAKKYSSSLPLIEKMEARKKIAKMSAALAASLFNTDDGVNLKINEYHVKFIYDYLNEIYDKPCMRYDLYSSKEMKKHFINDDDMTELIEEFKNKFHQWELIRDTMLDGTYFKQGTLFMQMGMSKEEGKEFLLWMTKKKLIRDNTGGLSKTPIFTKMLIKIINHTPIKKKEKEGEI